VKGHQRSAASADELCALDRDQTDKFQLCLRRSMKKIFASLTLAAFMLGATTAFAYTPNPSPTAVAKKKHKKKKKAAKAATTNRMK